MLKKYKRTALIKSASLIYPCWPCLDIGYLACALVVVDHSLQTQYNRSLNLGIDSGGAMYGNVFMLWLSDCSLATRAWPGVLPVPRIVAISTSTNADIYFPCCLMIELGIVWNYLMHFCILVSAWWDLLISLSRWFQVSESIKMN